MKELIGAALALASEGVRVLEARSAVARAILDAARRRVEARRRAREHLR